MVAHLPHCCCCGIACLRRAQLADAEGRPRQGCCFPGGQREGEGVKASSGVHAAVAGSVHYNKAEVLIS